MTHLCVSILVEQTDEALARALGDARAAINAGADLIEWRVDLVADQPDLVRALIEQSPAPCILTCRPTSEGGEYDGDEHDRLALLSEMQAEAQPRYVDLEWNTFEQLVDPSPFDQPNSDLILSIHDYKGRPTGLYNRFDEMAECELGSVLKVVWTARSLRDNPEAFDLLRNRPKPTIALCMGRFGLMSRILAPKFGGFLTFAALKHRSTTAPGQPTIDELLNVYRFNKINRKTEVFGLIGWPVEHSIGPRVINPMFDQLDANAVYLPMPIPPEYEHFKATVGAMLDHDSLDFHGAAVTAPHKESLVRFVRETGGRINESAEITGAANTLITNRSVIEAINTDADAAVDSVCHALDTSRKTLRNMAIGILGAGGAARSVAYGFTTLGANVYIHNRTTERAETLAADFAQHDLKVTPVQSLDDLRLAVCDILINTTPLGMTDGQYENQSPIAPGESDINDLPWHRDTLVFDLIYNPIETPFLKTARLDGCQTLNGLDMFARLTEIQLQHWTGIREIDSDALRNLVELASTH